MSLSTEAPAPPGDPVVVRLGVIDEATTLNASGTATVTIAAPNEPGDAVGTVQIGVVDFPFTVTVQAAAAPTETTTTTTLPAPTPPPPVTGLDDTATLAGLAGALVVAGLGVLATARRPTTAIARRGSVTHYRIVDGGLERSGSFGQRHGRRT